jgi:hypothetical protein
VVANIYLEVKSSSVTPGIRAIRAIVENIKRSNDKVYQYEAAQTTKRIINTSISSHNSNSLAFYSYHRPHHPDRFVPDHLATTAPPCRPGFSSWRTPRSPGSTRTCPSDFSIVAVTDWWNFMADVAGWIGFGEIVDLDFVFCDGEAS